MSCKYCKTYFVHTGMLHDGDILFVSPAKYTRIGDGCQYPIPSNFCPACGKRLRYNDESNKEDNSFSMKISIV